MPSLMASVILFQPLWASQFSAVMELTIQWLTQAMIACVHFCKAAFLTLSYKGPLAITPSKIRAKDNLSTEGLF
jgi:hypothetical protein